MGKISELAGETALYGLGSIVPRALNFLLFPIHTRLFDPEQYGVISYLYIMAAFLNVVCTFGMETAYFRYVAKGDNNAQTVFNVAQTLVVLVSLSLAALLAGFAYPLSKGLAIAQQPHLLIILAGIVFTDALFAIPFARLRLEKKPLRFAVARIGNVLILLAINLCLLVQFKNDQQAGKSYLYTVDYVLWANLAANLFYLLFFFKILLSWRPSFDRTLMRRMAPYAAPMMMAGLAGIINEMFSRWALGWWLPPDFYPGKNALYALGVFSVAFKYAIVMNLAIQAFRFAAEPFFFSNANEKNSPALFAQVNHFFVLATSFIFLVVCANLDQLKFLVGNPAYYEGLRAAPPLMLGYLMLGVYYNFSVWYKITEQTGYATAFAWAGAVFTLAANAVLIPYAGYLGSSWVPFLCYFFMAAASYLLGRRYFPIPYALGRSAAYLLLAGALVFLIRTFLDLSLLSALIRWTLIAAFALIVYRFEVAPLLRRRSGAAFE